MLQPYSKVIIADNTGATQGRVIQAVGRKTRKSGRIKIGDRVAINIQEASPGGGVKKGDVVQAVIVRTKRLVSRKDGSGIRFDHNAAVIIDKDQNPKGTRIFGPVTRELRELGFMKIISLASEVL